MKDPEIKLTLTGAEPILPDPDSLPPAQWPPQAPSAGADEAETFGGRMPPPPKAPSPPVEPEGLDMPAPATGADAPPPEPPSARQPGPPPGGKGRQLAGLGPARPQDRPPPQPPAAGTYPVHNPAAGANAAPPEGVYATSAPPPDPAPPVYYRAPTPPPFAPPPSAPPAPAEPPQKVRRVGTITMALCLVAVGALLLVRVFVPALDIVFIARFFPLVLVLMGLEILLANVFAGDRRIKYDILSVFICLILIVSGMVAAVVPNYITRERTLNEVNTRLAAELEEKTLAALQGGPYAGIAQDWYVNVRDDTFTADMTPADLKPGHYVQVRLYYGMEFADKEAFAAACHDVATTLLSVYPGMDYASFYSYYRDGNGPRENARYSFWADNRYQFEYTTEQIAAATLAEYWAGDNAGYVNEEAYQDRLEHPENYGELDEAALTEDGAPDEVIAEPAEGDAVGEPPEAEEPSEILEPAEAAEEPEVPELPLDDAA